MSLAEQIIIQESVVREIRERLEMLLAILNYC